MERNVSKPSQDMILDFSDSRARPEWAAIDDRIMGGCSQSYPGYRDNGLLRFAGEVSLENNGGFASIRSDQGAYNLSQYKGLKLRILGDGKTYKISLRTDVFYDGVSYQTSFATEAGNWQEIQLPFDAFTPTHHGIKLTTVAPMDTSSIRSFGLFIADKQEGSFSLDIEWIRGF